MNRYIFIVLAFLATPAQADCVCRCVNGVMKPLCTSSLDLAPICPARLCPMPPARMAPMPSFKLPPLGTTSCRQMQVRNPQTGFYEWRRVCR